MTEAVLSVGRFGRQHRQRRCASTVPVTPPRIESPCSAALVAAMTALSGANRAGRKFRAQTEGSGASP